jgi:hypothetical protein
MVRQLISAGTRLRYEQFKGLPSSEHFSADATLLEACASPRSFRLKDGSGERDAHGGGAPGNEGHVSTTDPMPASLTEPVFPHHFCVLRNRPLTIIWVLSNGINVNHRRGKEYFTMNPFD